MAALGTAFALTRLEVAFHRAARIDDVLVVATQIAAVRGPRLHFAQRIERDGEVICRAGVEAACIDPAGRARRPPAELRRALAPYLPLG